ncbi:MAG: IMP 5'-nucleotidase [Chrysothrix sp. TS-e1954]|nr:MAG: IMP 5'-nucleotidase [Chrysothrix sp. TS-e1954]
MAMAKTAHQRYAEIMLDVEGLIKDHIAWQRNDPGSPSKLKLLVPSIGNFFTPLPLHDAFVYQDGQRHISSRRFVPPSFNDVRLILNTAQVLSLVRHGPAELITFDGDVTLYDDGDSLVPENPVVSNILRLLESGVHVGIVTAAGYTKASKYYDRLYGLLDAITEAEDLSAAKKANLVVMGGEANYLYRFSMQAKYCLDMIPRQEWILDEMRSWSQKDIDALLSLAERALRQCMKTLDLDGQMILKERSVGIIPAPGKKFAREQLEETVLVTQRTLDMSSVGRKVPFCAFNGGNDVFVDIGDKSWGVLACQRFFGGIAGSKSLHIGDQFLSAGANDFKARLACTTAWIASPEEPIHLLNEMNELSNSDASSLQLNGGLVQKTRKPGRPKGSTSNATIVQKNEDDNERATRRQSNIKTRFAAEDDMQDLRNDNAVRSKHLGGKLKSTTKQDDATSIDEDEDADADKDEPEDEATSPPSRKRGRPKTDSTSDTIPAQATPAKRGPGRPRKTPISAKNPTASSGAGKNTATPASRPRGRPRKYPLPVADVSAVADEGDVSSADELSDVKDVASPSWYNGKDKGQLNEGLVSKYKASPLKKSKSVE